MDEKKYDRQLRLWASNGQKNLHEGKICMIGSTALCTETLKNIVLPGIGCFVIIDSGIKVSQDENDFSLNYFSSIKSKKLNENRAQEVTRLLCELNPDVKGECKIVDLNKLFSGDNFFEEVDSLFGEFDLILNGGNFDDISVQNCDKLSKYCYYKNIPYISIYSIGFYAAITVSIQEYTIVETHADSLVSLRLDNPWKKLKDTAFKINLRNLDPVDHAHIPFIFLLLIYLDQFQAAASREGKKENNKQIDSLPRIPTTDAEKSRFKEIIRAGAPANQDNENYEQALNSLWRLSKHTSIPPKIQEILNDNKAKKLTKDSTHFWIITRSVNDFINSELNENQFALLPLPGVLPDMKSDSKRYIELQNLYTEKANQDARKVENFVKQHLTNLGRSPDEISHEEIAAFCKNSEHLVIQRNSHPLTFYETTDKESHFTIENTLPLPKELMSSISDKNSVDYSSPAHVFFGFYCVNLFYSLYTRFPGSIDNEEQYEIDIENLILIGTRLYQKNMSNESKNQTLPEYTEKVLREFARAGGQRLHNICSLIGGMAAQEAVKIITRQYVPIDNCVAFDGIKSTTLTWKI